MDDPTTFDSLIAAVARTPPVAGVLGAPALPVGHVLAGNYVVEAELGRGGMGVVYRATDRTLGRRVAVKVLHADHWAGQPEALEAVFEREARATARLRHPSIVTVHHAGRDEAGHHFLVLELLHGQSLQARLASGPLSLERARAVFEQIGSAVEHAHARGILHRDLKPQNVFLGDDQRVCLLDFGLAALVDAGADGARRSRSGTPSAMAPEQWRGELQDERTDVWAMGLLLYRMLTGAPAPAVTDVAGLEAWLGGLDLAAVPGPLAAVVRRALAPTPAQRFPGARALLDAVAVVWPVVGLPVATAAPRRGRRRSLAAAVGVLAVVGLGAVGWRALRTPAAPPVERIPRADKLGTYRSDVFGELVLVADGDRVRGAYAHDEGLIVGRMIGDEVVGVWCELPSRRMPADAGEVRFRFLRDAGGRVLADGRWRYGRDGGWDELWDGYRGEAGPASPTLAARAHDVSIDCADPP